MLPAWYLPKGTINAAESQLEEASSSCERWGIWCGALVVAAVIAELIIAWIEPPYNTFLTESVVTDAAVAVGIVGEVLFGMLNNRIQTELRRRSNDHLGAAKKTAAEATERAAKAELETARIKAQLAPRSMTPEQQQAVAEKLKDFKGHHVFIAVNPELPESEMFARAIAAALRMGGLDIIFPARPTRMPLYPGGILVGFNSNTGSKDAALAIAQALFDVGVLAMPHPGESPNNTAWPSYVILTVGTKPDPEEAERAMAIVPSVIAQLRRMR